MGNTIKKVVYPVKPYKNVVVFLFLAGVGVWILYDTHSRIMSPSYQDMSAWDTIELYISLALTAALLLAMLLTPVVVLSVIISKALDLSISSMIGRMKDRCSRLLSFVSNLHRPRS